jgi:hypothetical protein
VIPSLRRLKPENCKLGSSLGYILRSNLKTKQEEGGVGEVGGGWKRGEKLVTC